MARIRAGTAAALFLFLGAMPSSAAAEASPAGAMSVEKVESGADRIEVRTTGAIYIFEPAKDRVLVSQRINLEREVAAITFKPDLLKALRVRKQDAFGCELISGDVRIAVARDSAIFVEPKDAVLKAEPLLPGAKPSDEKGGYSLHNTGDRTSFPDRWVLSVFPPREFDYERYSDGRWLWCDEPPSDEFLELAHRVLTPNYLHIHNPLWKAQPRYRSADFVNEAPERLQRSVRTAHRLGMKVQIYLNHNPTRDTEEKLTQVLANLSKVKEFGIDGVYWDEIGDTLPLRYRLLTETRRLLGPNVSIHIHDSRHYPEPFVYAHADWVVFGEHVDFVTVAKGREFLRAQSIRLRRSNIIGVYDPESRWVLPKEFLDEMLAGGLLAFHGPSAWAGDGFPEFSPISTGAIGGMPVQESERMVGYFFPRLEARRWDHRGRAGRSAPAEAAARADVERARAEAFLKEESAALKTGEVPVGIPLKAVTASRHVMAGYPRGFWQPSWAYDGSVATGAWMSAEPDAQLTLEFDGEKGVASVLCDTHFPGCKAEDVWQSSFTIAVSLDGKTWTPAVEKQGLEKAERFVVELKPPAKARFLKVHGIRGERKLDPTWHWSYVTEIQAYEAK